MARTLSGNFQQFGILTDDGGQYFQTSTVINKSEDTYELLDVLARDVGVLGIFSDWLVTVTYYANCMGFKQSPAFRRGRPIMVPPRRRLKTTLWF